MADFSKILEQAQQMQGRLEKIQDDLQGMSVTATSGGGMVTVEADGKGQITRIRIDPSACCQVHTSAPMRPSPYTALPPDEDLLLPLMGATVRLLGHGRRRMGGRRR